MPYTESGVGWQKTDTSHAAARTVKAATLKEEALGILLAYTGDGLTAEEIASALHRPYGSIQPRISELRNDGKVIDTGIRRRGQWGKMIIVWAANG